MITDAERQAILDAAERASAVLNSPFYVRMNAELQAAYEATNGLAARVLSNFNSMQKELIAADEGGKAFQAAILAVTEAAKYIPFTEQFSVSERLILPPTLSATALAAMSRPHDVIEKPEWTKISRPLLKRKIGFMP